MSDQTGTEIATLPPADRAALALGSSKAEIQLREIVKESAEITTVIDVAGREQAHRAGMKLKNARTAIKNTGKVAREDAQAFSTAVIAEEKRLINIIESEETRVFDLRDGYDAKVKAEKAEKDRIEKERVDGIKQKIVAISGLPMAMHGESALEIELELNALITFEPSDADFMEFKAAAKEAVDATVEALSVMLERTKAMEAEAARLAAERADLERLQAEAAECARVVAEEQAAIDASNKAAAEAESARIAQEREQLEADRRAFAEQQDAAKREADAAAEKTRQDALNVGFGINQTIDSEEVQEQKNQQARAALDAVSIGVDPVGSAGDQSCVAIFEGGLLSELVCMETTLEQVPVEPTANDNIDPSVRQIAIHTAEQFAALARKVLAVGFVDFADQLTTIGMQIDHGNFDAQIAQADRNELILADDALAMASVHSRTAGQSSDERAA